MPKIRDQNLRRGALVGGSAATASGMTIAADPGAGTDAAGRSDPDGWPASAIEGAAGFSPSWKTEAIAPKS